MKTPYVALLVTLLATSASGCGDATSPVTTAIDFWIDPAVCFNVGTPNLGLRFSVDEVYRLTDTLSVGEHSKAIPVTPGTHTTFAAVDSPYGGPTWTGTVNVEPNQTVSVRVGC